MALPPSPSTRPRIRALTASAARLGEPSSDAAVHQRQGWQAQALSYVRIVPELSFASRFYSKMMRNMRIYPARLEADGSATRITDDLPVQLLNRIQDPGGGIQNILGQFGRLMFITGEGWLFGRDLNTEMERWSFVWTDELDFERGVGDAVVAITHKPTSAAGRTMRYESPSQAVAYRMWTPDPGSSGEPEAPMRAALQVARELIALTDAVMATAVSRTTQGMLLMPQDIAPAPAEAGSDEDPLMEPLMEDLVKHLIAAKENIGTAEAVAPFILSGAYDQLDQIRMLQIHDTQNDYAERELRREAVERLAQGLDMPKEMLTGVGQTNHWAAKQIMDDRWRSHGSELGHQFCNDLNEAYYRPALRDAGVENWREIIVGMDDSQIIQPADMMDAAKEAIKMVAIGRPGLRRLLNISDDLAPDPDEEEFLIDFLKKGTPSVDEGRDSGEPPPPGPEGDSGRRTRVVASAGLNGGAEREHGAAEIALLRCRELAGNRIRNRDKVCASGIDPQHVASSIGVEGLLKLGLEPRSLVKGGADLLRPILASLGYSSNHVDTFCETIEAFATKTLLEPEVSLPHNLTANLALVKS